MNHFSYDRLIVHPTGLTTVRVSSKPNKSGNNPYQVQLFDEGYDAYKRIANSNRKHSENLSVNAKRKLLKAIDYLLFISKEKEGISKSSGKRIKFRVNFVTLTLSSKQIHDDKIITNTLLNQFLVEIRKYHQVKNYIYRAEKQKNGNIHYHLLIDTFIDYTSLRDTWNRIQQKLGYVTRYSENMREWHKNGFQVRKELLSVWPLEKQFKAYKEGLKSNFTRPNSTDIHSLRKIRNIRAYLIKYLTKETQNKSLTPGSVGDSLTISGRLWSCSQSLSDIKGFATEVDSFLNEMLSRLKRCSAVRIYQTKYFSIFNFDIRELFGTPLEQLLLKFLQYCSDTFQMDFQVCLRL